MSFSSVSPTFPLVSLPPLWRLAAVLLSLTALWSCEKDKPAPAALDTSIHLRVMRGANQRDTIGHIVPDTIMIQVLRGTVPAPGYMVRFEQDGCDVGTVSLISAYTSRKGIAWYRWRLSGAVGAQQLTVRVFDSTATERATTRLSATAITPTTGWHPAVCMPQGVSALCQLPNGRVLAGINYRGYLYYSDNEGVTWQRNASFPGPEAIAAITATPTGEIFVATGGTNAAAHLYYSADNGQTWQDRTAGIHDARMVQDVSYTRNGKLFVSTYFGGLSVSSDKGRTWTVANGGLSSSDRYRNVVELATGELLVVNYSSSIYKSTTGGLTWNRLSTSPFSVRTLFGDANGDLYAGVDQCDGTIYRSTNDGATWQKIYTAPPVVASCLEVHDIAKVGNTYFFMVRGVGLVRTADFVSYTRVRRWNNNFSFLSTRNQTILLEEQGELWYHLP